MNFFKILFIIIFSFMANFAFADNHDQKQEVLDAAKEIVKEMEEDEFNEAMGDDHFNFEDLI